VLFHLGVITQLLGWGMVPDVPLITWNLLLANLVMSLRQQFHWQLWMVFGVVVGLTGLTKYTAIAIPVSIAIWLLREKQFIQWLKQPGLWLSIVIAIIMILPVLLWNHWNQWISFDYQFNHGTEGTWKWSNVARMQLVQFATYSPLLFGLGIAFLLSRIPLPWTKTAQKKRFQQGIILPPEKDNSGESYLLISALVNLAIVGWSSGNGELLPHWAAIGWLLLTPLAAHQLTLSWNSLSGKIWTSIAGGLSIIIAALGFLL